MSEPLSRHDDWLGGDKAPAALVIREYLMAVEGHDGVLFPATFAAGAGFPGGYNIDPEQGVPNVCLIDSVGSQANRTEPLFAKEPYSKLVPQVTIQAGSRKVNLLEAGHRAGDAVVRCSGLAVEVRAAFEKALAGDDEPLAKLAPTSLVFGVWDSRDTQAKRPRLIASTIRAFNVRRLRRSAQYMPAVEYVEEGLLPDRSDLRDAEGNLMNVSEKHPYAKRGFVHVPASASHGGVIADGGIRRDATLQLAALGQLSASADVERTTRLRRYILGLALTAVTHQPATYLRQGCNLVLDPKRPREFQAVYATGERTSLALSHIEALEYALEAARLFGVGGNREVVFEPDAAKKEIEEATSDSAKKNSRGKKAK
ncbi:MAG: type I-U CRISPR-associated protein Cas7 [Planctomycetes bacterium]|nr:type I-U CRISPR-associated protein Cas7 [Planctomycetota bacterium]